MARGINTKCLHLEEEEGCCNNYGSISFPIYQTATYAHPAVGQSTGFDYSRLQNPTREHLEKSCNSGKRNRRAGLFHRNGSHYAGNGAV